MSAQPLNYTTRFLEHYRENEVSLAGLPNWQATAYKTVYKIANESHVFQLPEGGTTINEATCMPGAWGEYLKLPYPVTAFEYLGDPEKAAENRALIIHPRYISLCVDIAHFAKICPNFVQPGQFYTGKETTGFIQVSLQGWTDSRGSARWSILPMFSVVGPHLRRKFTEDQANELRERSKKLMAAGLCNPDWLDGTEGLIKDMAKSGDVLGTGLICLAGCDADTDELVHAATGPLVASVQACVTLACKNCKAERTQPPAALNKKRQASGKVPLRAFHVLTIDGKRIDEGEDLGGTHASPRRHFRRAHIRRYQDGSMTWVRHTIVNRHRAETLDKNYDVTKQGEVQP